MLLFAGGRAALVVAAAAAAVAVLLAAGAPRAQAGPVASPGNSWERQRHAVSARMLHPTCDTDYIWLKYVESCQMSRRRRRREAAAEEETATAPPEEEDEDANAVLGGEGDGEGAPGRQRRSPAESLFNTCCQRHCNTRDFVGVCP